MSSDALRPRCQRTERIAGARTPAGLESLAVSSRMRRMTFGVIVWRRCRWTVHPGKSYLSRRLREPAMRLPAEKAPNTAARTSIALRTLRPRGSFLRWAGVAAIHWELAVIAA